MDSSVQACMSLFLLPLRKAYCRLQHSRQYKVMISSSLAYASFLRTLLPFSQPLLVVFPVLYSLLHPFGHSLTGTFLVSFTLIPQFFFYHAEFHSVYRCVLIFKCTLSFKLKAQIKVLISDIMPNFYILFLCILI